MSESDNSRWAIGFSLLATAISLASLVVSIRSCSVTERSMKLHLQPAVICVLDDHPDRDHFLLFSVKNEGPIAAVNVSVDLITLRYSKKEKEIRLGSPAGGPVLEYNPPGRRWMFVQRLDPNDREHKLTGESALRDAEVAIDVLLFDVEYYREADGERFSKRCAYYVEGPKIFSASEFRDHPEAQQVLQETSRYLEATADMTYPWPKTRQ